MNIATILQMAACGNPDRVAISSGEEHVTYQELADRVQAATVVLSSLDAPRVVYLSGNDSTFPVALFASAAVGIPFLPINYRLGSHQLDRMISSQPSGTVVLHSDSVVTTAMPTELTSISASEWHGLTIKAGRQVAHDLPGADDDDIAVLLYTSGTSAEPKSAVLRQRHLTSYILGSIEFAAASSTDAVLVTVPPYHIAGIANALSNIYAGRRIVYLDRFTPEAWIDLAFSEGITNAMLVPTMLARLVHYLNETGMKVPPVRHLSYGGSRMPLPVIERALELFPNTDFVNAYGLTETSSTIAVLGPEQHRQAQSASDPAVRNRLSSAGRIVPGIEVQMRDEQGEVLTVGIPGEMWVRGPQVSGEYVGVGSVVDEEGWFPTKDLAYVDDEQFLFIEGRLDDTIIRGGENISPTEVEDVILRYPGVVECAVVGVPDDEWGHRLSAAIVLNCDEATFDVDGLKGWITARLRSSKTPDEIVVWDGIPRTPTGKMLRRRVLEKICA